MDTTLNTKIAKIEPKAGEDFASLLEKSSFGLAGPIQEGEIVKGKVIDVTHDAVIVDFGYKSEGQVPLDEFIGAEGKPEVQIGDDIEVYIEEIERDDGLAVLSKEKADALKIWDRLQDVVDTDGTIDGVVVSKVKGGLSVDIGVKAFLPASQIDVRPPGNLDKLLGRRFKLKILKLNKRKGNIIVSRRSLVEKDRDYARQEVLQNIGEGQVVKGTVKNITDYGAFIDLGGMDGLLHVTDMTWGRSGHPSDVLQVGQEISVKVLKVDPDSGKVSLGLKQLTADPWVKVPEKYEVGARIEGKVVTVTDYGAFIELEGGVEGLVHISEMSWSRKAKHPSKIVNVGDIVECAILDLDPAARRISLGMKQIRPNPWQVVLEKYPIGAKISGPVKSITDFGVFIGLEGDVDGLIHISDLAWVRPARPLSMLYPKKRDVEAIVLNIDVESERISLGVKQLSEDIWPRIEKEYGIGKRHSGQVVHVSDKGIAVELEPGVEGFIPISGVTEEGSTEEGSEEPSHKLSVGDKIETVVHSIEEKERRIHLGLVLEGGDSSQEKKRSKK